MSAEQFLAAMDSMSEEMRAAHARNVLDALGARRVRLKTDEESLRKDTRTGLRAARGLVPIAEAARRAGLNRSTVYELYLAQGDEENGGAAHGGSTEGQ